MRVGLFSLVAAALASPAMAAEYLTEVTSQVYLAPGRTAKELAGRAQTCIAQNLRSGTVNAPQIVSSDLETGVIVANNALKFGSLPEWQIRSRLTFEAREGRFRISQTGLEMFNDMAGGWNGIGKWFGSPWKKAQATYEASAAVVAACVVAAPKREDW